MYTDLPICLYTGFVYILGLYLQNNYICFMLCYCINVYHTKWNAHVFMLLSFYTKIVFSHNFGARSIHQPYFQQCRNFTVQVLNLQPQL